jgi:serine/threonine-protein kinase
MSESPGRQADGPAPAKELTGRIGKFEIAKPLGKGAMGMVYLAHDTVLERDVALKVMVAQIADDPELRKRFEREAKAVAKMTHPNVVTVFDLGYHEGSPYIAMELLKGMDLQKAVRQGPGMSLERKVTIITQVLAGLAHAHQSGIVHRDVKPANIFINQDGTVKIMDFGVARLTTASMTGTGNIVGTADYMSPEQVKGAHVDGRSDVFAVGCMLFELLAGRRPFHADNLMAIFYKITHDDPNWDLIPGGPEYDSLLPILRKALAKVLEERYQTAYEFAIDLRNYLRVHATSPGGQHALEGLIDLEPPPSSPPQPLTDVPAGATVVEGDVSGATVDLSAARGRGTATPPTTLRAGGAGPTAIGGTRSGAPTVVPPLTAPGTMAPTVRAPVPQRAPQRARVEARPAPAPLKPGHPVLYAALGALTVALITSGGYIYWKQTQPPPSPPPVTEAAAPPSVTPATVAPTLPPPTAPPTTAPPPTFAEATGKAAAAMRSAQRSFREQDYDKAVSHAQGALRDDPGNGDARKLLDNAQAGQKAQAQFRAAEQALGRGDFAAASAAAQSGRDLAPWDSRGPTLQSRIQDAQARAQAQAQQQAQQQQAQQQQALRARQLNDALSKADEALLGQKYDQAIAFYDEALRIDPDNPRAIGGKGNAVQARVLAQTAALGTGVRPGAGKSFVLGKTAASSAETRAGGAVPDGFEETAGVSVKKGTQAADLPGKISFDVVPDHVKALENFTVKIYMQNEGSAPISIKDMLVTSIVNGRRGGGALTPLVRDVAPRQRALLYSIGPDVWKEDTTTWVLEVMVRTLRGETYKNTVTWK